MTSFVFHIILISDRKEEISIFKNAKQKIVDIFTKKPIGVEKDINLEPAGNKPYIKLEKGTIAFHCHLTSGLTYEIYSENRSYLEKLYNKILTADSQEEIILKNDGNIVLSQIKGNMRTGMKSNDTITFGRRHLVSTNFPSDIQLQPPAPEYPVDSSLFQRLSPEARARYNSPYRQNSKVKSKPRHTGNKTVKIKGGITFTIGKKGPSSNDYQPYNPAYDEVFDDDNESNQDGKHKPFARPQNGVKRGVMPEDIMKSDDAWKYYRTMDGIFNKLPPDNLHCKEFLEDQQNK